MTARNIVGNVPEPQDLYGRDDFLAHLWRQIEGNNVLLLAPRRFGKTGVMNHVLNCPRAGRLPVYLDLEDVDSPAEFAWRLVREVLSHSRLRSFVGSVRGLPRAFTEWLKDNVEEAGVEGAKVKFKESIAENWRDAARKLVVELEKAEPTIVFIFNELMADLECDWYLVLDTRTNEYHFLLHVMRDWWRRWYGPPARKTAAKEK